MFSFRRPLDGQDYAWSAALRNGAFVAITLAFPFLLRSVIQASSCRGIGGACGALALVLSIYIKPLIFIAFILSYVLITMRRLRDAGLSLGFAAGLAVLMLADIHWATAMGAPWSVAFVTGFMGSVPVSLMAGLALVATLSILGTMQPPPEVDAPRPRRALGTGAWIFIGLLIVAAAATLIGAVAMWRGGFRLVVSMHRGVLAPVIMPAKIAVVMAPAILAAFWYREWRREGRFGMASPWLFAVGLCIGVVVIGSAVMATVATWNSLALVLALRGSPLPAQVVHIAGLAELLALLILPWLLSMLPRSPSAAPTLPSGPAAPPPLTRRPVRAATGGLQAPGAGAVAFGRRGAR